jgi:hypothetical protein
MVASENVSEHTRVGLLALSGLLPEDGAPFTSVVQIHLRSGFEFQIPWPFNGDCIDNTTGEWFWSALTEYDDDDNIVMHGSWAYVYGSNGSIDDEVWVEHPQTWHFYGFADDEVYSVCLLQPLLRPKYGLGVRLRDSPEIATQCDRGTCDSLSSIRFAYVNGEISSDPSISPVWADSAPFSKAVTSNLSCGKFSFGTRSRTHRSVGVLVRPADWTDNDSPLPPMGVIKRENRLYDGQEYPSDEEYSYDPYDKE